jgi:hypothetical protein
MVYVSFRFVAFDTLKINCVTKTGIKFYKRINE